jgi:hypothetical protein
MIPAMGQTQEEVLQKLANEWLLIKRCGRPEEVGTLVDGGFTKAILP